VYLAKHYFYFPLFPVPVDLKIYLITGQLVPDRKYNILAVFYFLACYRYDNVAPFKSIFVCRRVGLDLGNYRPFLDRKSVCINKIRRERLEGSSKPSPAHFAVFDEISYDMLVHVNGDGTTYSLSITDYSGVVTGYPVAHVDLLTSAFARIYG